MSPTLISGPGVVAATTSGVDFAWTWSPLALAGPLLCLAIYGRLWWRARAEGRPSRNGDWRAVVFVMGVVALLFALVSPISRLGEQMFVWHMVQHIVLVDIAPILLVAGCSAPLLQPVMARLEPYADSLQWLARPATAVIFYVGALWIWHAPVLYNLALTNPFVHAFQHASLFAVGVLFWWHVFEPVPSRHSIRGPGVFPFMAATKFFTGVLASLITFLPEAGLVYSYYVDQPRMWGFTAASDQQLGGAIMVTEELVLMVTAFAFMFIRMLSQANEDDEDWERLNPSSAQTASDTETVAAPLSSAP